jgi:hypothetical protein
VSGFRKGKAPPQMVLNHFGKKSISAEACESIIGQAHILKKVLSIVTVYRDCARALTFENFCSTGPLCSDFI